MTAKHHRAQWKQDKKPTPGATVIAVSGAAAALLVGGFALAGSAGAEPSSAPEPRAATNPVRLCVDKRTAVVTKRARCGQRATPLVLNQRGPTGPAGAPGPSHGYLNQSDNVSVAAPNTIDGALVAQLSVPAGSYVLTGNANGISGTGSTNLACWFAAGSYKGTEARSRYPGDGYRAGVSPTGATTLTSAGIIQLRCATSAVESTIVGYSMTATRIGALTDQSP